MRPGLRAVPAAPLAVPALFVICGDIVVAVDSARVGRLSLVDELPVVRPLEVAPSTAGVVDLDGSRLPAWDLAALLLGGEERGAWIIVRGRGAVGDFALRTGRCACVRPLPPRMPIPAPLRIGSGRAVRGVFRTAELGELAGYPCGYELALDELLGPTELGQAAELARRGMIAW